MKTAHVDRFSAERLPRPDTWPEFIFDKHVPPYEDYLNAAEALLNNGFENRPAIYMNDLVWTYDELNHKAKQIAQILTQDLDLKPGNRVLLRGGNTPILAALWYGVLMAGGVVITTMTMLREKELDAIIDVGRPDILIIENDLPIDLLESSADKAKHVVSFSNILIAMINKNGDFKAVETASNDVALLAFTSGTTGIPKATMHFHRDILAMADSFAKYILSPSSEDVFCGSPPLAFTFGLGGLLVFPARFGASVVYFDGGGPDVILNTIETYKVTTFFTAPTAYKLLVDQIGDRDVTSLKTCVSAGEYLPVSVSDDFYRATGIRLIDGIGATEMIHVFISSSRDEIRPGSTGKVVPGYRAEIWDKNNKKSPVGVAGRLVVKGPTGCRYLNGDHQEKYVVDGWNLTGDIFTQDADGYFWFVARDDDIIISAGYNIASPEVEQAVIAHDAVAECAVVGTRDPDRGMIVKAFIVLNEGFNSGDELAKDIQVFVKETIAPYKYPRAIEFIESLPKSATGKLLRKDLKN